MAELRYYLTPLDVEVRGENTYRTLPYWNSRWHTDRAPAVSTAVQVFGGRDFAIASIVAEPAEHDGFVAQGAIELPRSGRITVAKLNAIRAMIGLVYVPNFLNGNSDGLTVIRALGVVAQLCQRIRGRFGQRMEDADRTRFAELGSFWAPLAKIATIGDRLDAAVALWESRPILTGGIDLGFSIPVAGGALPATDAFTNTNGTNVATHDSRWVNTSGTWTIQSNQVQVPTSSAEVGAAFDDADFIDNHGAVLAFTTNGNYNVGASARHATGANTYYTHYGEIGVATAVYDVDGTVATELYRTGTCALNDILGISVVGTTIRAFKNGTQVTSVTDSTWSTGVGGIAGWANTTTRGDNFEAYNCPLTVLATTTGTASGQTHNPGTGVTPKAVVAFMFGSTDATDRVSSITYGTEAMTRVPTNGFAQDTAGEPCAIVCYTLLSGIPTGSVSVTYSATGTQRLTVVSFDSVWSAVEIKASGKQEGDAANPSISLDSSTDTAVRVMGLMSGGASVAPAADYGVELSEQALSGAFTCWVGHHVFGMTGNVTIGATAASDDVAAIAIALGESAGAAPSKRRYSLALAGVG